MTGGVMTARKMILLTLAVLLPCGFLILLVKLVLKSSFGERFLKGATTMRKLAFLASAVLSVALAILEDQQRWPRLARFAENGPLRFAWKLDQRAFDFRCGNARAPIPKSREDPIMRT
jgi:hypothetical protein